MDSNQKRFLKLITSVQDAYRNSVYLALQAQISYFADNYEEGRTVTDLPTKPLTKVLRALYESAGLQNALYVRQQIKRQARKAAPTDPIEKLRWMTNEFYRQNLLTQAVAPITKTTKKQIEMVLQQANAEGWGVKKTVSALKSSDITRSRAELIVRTETMKAANAGAMLSAAEMDIAVQKKWISANDSRTRRIPRDQYDHLHMSGRTVNYADYFIVPSTKSIDAMQYPGDPTASAGNVCNCRCTVAFVPIRDGAGNLVPMSQTMPTAGNQFLRIATLAASFSIGNMLINELISTIENDNF
jgi:hypothetical protein